MDIKRNRLYASFLVALLCMQLGAPLLAFAETSEAEPTTESEIPSKSESLDRTLESFSENSTASSTEVGVDAPEGSFEETDGSQSEVFRNDTTYENNHLLPHDDSANPQASYRNLTLEKQNEKIVVNSEFFAGNTSSKTTLSALMLYSKRPDDEQWKKEKDFFEDSDEVVLSENEFVAQAEVKAADPTIELRYLVQYTVETFDETSEVSSAEQSQGFFPLETTDFNSPDKDSNVDDKTVDQQSEGTENYGISPFVSVLGGLSVVQPIANPASPVIRVQIANYDPGDTAGFYLQVDYSGGGLARNYPATTVTSTYFEVKMTGLPTGNYNVRGYFVRKNDITVYGNYANGIGVRTASVAVARPEIAMSNDGTGLKINVKSSASSTNCTIQNTSSQLWISNNYYAQQSGNVAKIPNINVGSGTVSYNNYAGLAKGGTYYICFVLKTDYSEIGATSAASTITMPNVTTSGQAFTIDSTGTKVNLSVKYELKGSISDVKGTRNLTSIKTANTFVRIFDSLANANPPSNNFVKQTIASVDATNKTLFVNNIQDLVPGKQYWFRFCVATNFTGVAIWSNLPATFVMPKITLGTPFATVNGNGPALSVAGSSMGLVGSNASIKAGTPTMYFYESEADADAKKTSGTGVSSESLSFVSPNIQKNNITGLTPGKTYWIRTYCETNYTQINTWSEKATFTVPYVITEDYYDQAGTFLKTETVVITTGLPYQPSGASFNHSSINYHYFGWLNDTEAPGTDSPRRTALPTFDTTGSVKLIYIDEADALYLESVPIFNFGTDNQIFSYDSYYGLDASKYGGSTNDLFVAFSDKRGATSTGWKVTAKLSDLSNPADSSAVLTNAELKMSKELELLDSMNTWISTVPGTIAGNDGTDVNLQANGAEITVFSSATPADSVGSWRNKIAFNSVQLKVPGGLATQGMTYQGKVTWTVDDTP